MNSAHATESTLNPRIDLGWREVTTPKRILIIDDETLVRRALADYLKEFGYETVTAADGAEGLAKARAQPFHAVLVDLRMPHIDGLEVIAVLKTEQPELPVVVVSGTGVLSDAIEAMRRGAWDYVTKPVQDMGEITVTLERVLQTARLRAERNHYQLELEELNRSLEEEVNRQTRDLRLQTQQLQQIMDTVPEGVFLLDSHRRVMLANPVGEKSLVALSGANVGDTLTSLGNQPVGDLLTTPHKGWQEIKVRGQVFDVIARAIEGSATPGGWVVVIRDMTEQREMQQRALQQERLAAVGQLATGIAHDFNNIMAVIVLYTRIALSASPDLSPKSQRRLKTVIQQAKQASDLIQQILDFSRRSVIERQPLNLVPLLKEQVRLWKRTLPETIQTELLSLEEMDECIINADPTRIQQMMMNLALNARDAMPDGGKLSVGIERIQVQRGKKPPLPELNAGVWVRVTVTDTGTGIPAAVVRHIFDPFFTTKAPGQGTGLGLAQVYGIIKQHEGEIDVESVVGQGTTFTIYLPEMRVDRPERTAADSPPLATGAGQTILVVEDNANTREALVDTLNSLNYRALAAANGHEALEILKRGQHEIALILSDVVMPEMGGIALFHAVREESPAVKTVLLTGHLMKEELENLRADGLSDWLPKPPDLERLAKTIAQALA